MSTEDKAYVRVPDKESLEEGDVLQFDIIPENVDDIDDEEFLEYLITIIEKWFSITYQRIMAYTPINHGELITTWEVKLPTTDDLTLSLYFTAPYANAVHDGHRIVSHGVEVGWQEGTFWAEKILDDEVWRLDAEVEKAVSLYRSGGWKPTVMENIKSE